MNILSIITFKMVWIQAFAVLTWQTPTDHDFGLIEQGEPVEYTFEFKNTSQDTMLIDNVRTTCGCTVPNWSIDPIFPDSSSQIQVIYDAKKLGYFRKKIKVFVNTQRKGETLTIRGEVE